VLPFHDEGGEVLVLPYILYEGVELEYTAGEKCIVLLSKPGDCFALFSIDPPLPG
jgi:hypothetical protein